jgi:hypothetical protein
MVKRKRKFSGKTKTKPGLERQYLCWVSLEKFQLKIICYSINNWTTKAARYSLRNYYTGNACWLYFDKNLMYFQVTQAHLVPPIILFLAKHPVVSKFDLSSITLKIICYSINNWTTKAARYSLRNYVKN